MSEKIRAQHLSRKAILYVRQSSAYQVRHNLESQKLQYAMQERLQQLGWRESEVVDEELGAVRGGVLLAGMLQQGYHGSEALVLAIPEGGVPVAAEIAARLALPLDVAPVSKVLLPWTTEGGYGAVAFDGTVWIDDDAAQRFVSAKNRSSTA